MTDDAAARERAQEVVNGILQRLDNDSLNWREALSAGTDDVLTFASHEAERARAEEREACALIAVDACWEATDMKRPKARWQHQVAKEIAEAIRARRNAAALAAPPPDPGPHPLDGFGTQLSR